MRSRDNQDADRRPAPAANVSGAGSSNADEATRIRRLEEPKAPVGLLVDFYISFLRST